MVVLLLVLGDLLLDQVPANLLLLYGLQSFVLRLLLLLHHQLIV